VTENLENFLINFPTVVDRVLAISFRTCLLVFFLYIIYIVLDRLVILRSSFLPSFFLLLLINIKYSVLVHVPLFFYFFSLVLLLLFFDERAALTLFYAIRLVQV